MEFDKDFGYLMPFIDKVSAAAGEIEDTGARDEAVRLVADQKQRWQRIRQLLSQTTSSPRSATNSPPAAKGSATTQQGQSAATASGVEAPPQDVPVFTVGSLRGK